jgi:hypothetical protein
MCGFFVFCVSGVVDGRHHLANADVAAGALRRDWPGRRHGWRPRWLAGFARHLAAVGAVGVAVGVGVPMPRPGPIATSCARAMQVLDAHCHYARQQAVQADTTLTKSNAMSSQPLLSVQVGVDGATAVPPQPALQADGGAGMARASSSPSSMYTRLRSSEEKV